MLNINYEIMTDIRKRGAAVAALAERARQVPTSWHQHLAEASLTLTSPDRGRIVKIDSNHVYTLDVKQPNGEYRSHRFPCASVDEAWTMAFQIVKTYRPQNAIH